MLNGRRFYQSSRRATAPQGRYAHMASAIQELADLTQQQKQARADLFFADCLAFFDSDAAPNSVQVGEKTYMTSKLAEMIRRHAGKPIGPPPMSPERVREQAEVFVEQRQSEPRVADVQGTADAILRAHAKATGERTSTPPPTGTAGKIIVADRKRRGELE